jgi:ribosomal protein S7
LKLRTINIFFSLKYQLKLRENEDPYLIFLISMLNISPQIFPKKLWVAGANRVLAFPIYLKKQIFLGIRWLLQYCKDNKNLNLEKLINILIESLYNKGEL